MTFAFRSARKTLGLADQYQSEHEIRASCPSAQQAVDQANPRRAFVAKLLVVGAVCAGIGLPAGAFADALFRVVRVPDSATNLIANGSFESDRNSRLVSWQQAPQGMSVADGQGRTGGRALVCESTAGTGWYGASQTIVLNREMPRPMVIRGWSRAQDVGGSADSGYSIYVDLIYSDGTPLWGQTGNFRCGTHDWEKREFFIFPEKPVRSLTLHCLFRGHAGRAWFDDVSAEEIGAPSGTALFQGVPVELPQPTSVPGIAGVVTNVLRRGQNSSTRQLVQAAGGDFSARDVAARSDFVRFKDDTCGELKLKLESVWEHREGHLSVSGKVLDEAGADRAVTFMFTLPVEAKGLYWGDDVRHARVIQGDGEYVNTVNVRCGATGTMSLYPVAAIWDDSHGLALALDMAKPGVCRLGYHAGLERLFIAYDFGLVHDTQCLPGGAEFRFVLYGFDPAWGFRSAWDKLMRIFPDYFEVRAREHGLWMPFTDVSKVPGWEDFGFKFHEGDNNVVWDDAHGVLSFRYTEPMTWWMSMKPGVPRTADSALSVLNAVATGNDGRNRSMAEAARLAVMHDEAGQPCLLFRKEPWCDGAVWSLNPNPWLGSSAAGEPGLPYTNQPLNAATVHWNDRIKERLYGQGARGRRDGEYLDSLEGYVTAELNFRREHFRYSTVPLTFDTASARPALFKGLAVFEFTKWISDDVHRMAKLAFANSVPYRFTFLCPWLDVMGTETDWLSGNRYQPPSDSIMSLRRTMAAGKPYLLLMNSDYDKFTPERVERYFQRALFYGMWPGFFSHNAADNPYWQNPKWYERDRPLFRRYIPVVRRVSEAGWQPVSRARSDNPQIWVERFGPDSGGSVSITLFNATDTPQSGKLAIEITQLGLRMPCNAIELLSNNAFEWPANGWQVTLKPHETKVISLTTETIPQR